MWFFETSRVSIEEGGEVEVSDGSEGALKSVWLLGSHLAPPSLGFRVKRV